MHHDARPSKVGADPCAHGAGVRDKRRHPSRRRKVRLAHALEDGLEQRPAYPAWLEGQGGVVLTPDVAKRCVAITDMDAIGGHGVTKAAAAADDEVIAPQVETSRRLWVEREQGPKVARAERNPLESSRAHT